MDRRRLLALGGLSAGAAAGSYLGIVRETTPAAATADTAHHHAAGSLAARGSARVPPPFSVPMPVPRQLEPTFSTRHADVYDLPIRKALADMLPGVKTPILSYGGTFVGPTIRARRGRAVMVRYRNELDEPANAHLHGGHVPPDSDGHPMDTVAPGATRTLHYPNNQLSATLWYHGHAHHREAEHVYRGLHGFYLIEDPVERRLRLPEGRYDVPIMLQDVHFDEHGGLIYAPTDTPNRTTLLANGRPQPYFPVAARRYRFRLLNASNFRTYHLTLGSGGRMIQIGSDGGLLPAPVPRDELVLSPGERIEIVIDFSHFRPGARIVLSDVAGPVLRFDVHPSGRDGSAVPPVLRPLPPLIGGPTDREVTMRVDMTAGAAYIDGRSFDAHRIDSVIRRGATEIWRISNLDTDVGLEHNLHLHLVQFRVLDRDGRPPLPGESGLKDTVLVPPGTSVRVQATFGPFLGRYVYHCHMLEHSDAGMMAQLQIVE